MHTPPSRTEMVINTDGGSRGNPGPAAIGAVFQINGKTFHTLSRHIGLATNNVAEYTAVLAALEWLISSKSFLTPRISSITFNLDSKLVVEQLNGYWKIKNQQLFTLNSKIQNLISRIPLSVTFNHIPRELNSAADAMVNQALDRALW